jgi:malonyl-CoA/methylmalonyl-CoA synthetase
MSFESLLHQSLISMAATPGLDVDVPGHGLRTLTFGDIDVRARRMARALAARGVSRGDRLALHLPNRLEFIDLFLASLQLGAIFVPINILYKERELAHVLLDADPRLLVATVATRSLLPPATPFADIETLVHEANGCAPLDGPWAGGGDDVAALIYTSGTTGRSKGAALSHDNFAANTAAIVSSWRITRDDRYLAVLPLFHVHGLANGLCAWLATGCRMRLVERFDHQKAAALFEDFQPTLFFGVPTIYVRLLDLEPTAAAAIGRTMRLFVSGSAPLPAHVFETFRLRFGHEILERYGMSETLMLISNPYDGERRPGTVGVPLPGVSVRMVDADFTPVADGETGQVLVQGANVFRGYWGNPDATTSAFVDGWFKTGDLAVRAADGYITLTGRASDVIISGGFNIYPREIEEFLLELPGVREVAVAAAADPRRGEVPVAYVVPDATFDAEAARDACVKALASFKCPRAFVTLDALPRNALGKVQKHLLPTVTTS